MSLLSCWCFAFTNQAYGPSSFHIIAEEYIIIEAENKLNIENYHFLQYKGANSVHTLYNILVCQQE